MKLHLRIVQWIYILLFVFSKTLIQKLCLYLTDTLADANVTNNDSDNHSDPHNNNESVDNFNKADLNKGVQPNLDLTCMEDVALDMDGYAKEEDNDPMFEDFKDDFPDDNQSD